MVFLSVRKSLQSWQRRSGGLITRLRFFLSFLRGAAAASGRTPAATAAAAAAAVAAAVAAAAAAAASGSLSSGRTPAASCAALAHVQVPVQLSVLHGSCRSSSSTMSFEQLSQYWGYGSPVLPRTARASWPPRLSSHVFLQPARRQGRSTSCNVR